MVDDGLQEVFVSICINDGTKIADPMQYCPLPIPSIYDMIYPLTTRKSLTIIDERRNRHAEEYKNAKQNRETDNQRHGSSDRTFEGAFFVPIFKQKQGDRTI